MEFLNRYRIPIILALLFIGILVLVTTGVLKNIDYSIDVWSRGITNSSIHNIFIVITNMGSTKIITGISLLVMLFAFNRLNNTKVLTLLVSSSLGCYLLNSVIKNMVDRPRPPLPHLVVEHTFSFPSGHAMISICFYATISYILTNVVKDRHFIIKVWLYLLAILIAISRVILHVHYFSDVLAGFILGYALFRTLKIKFSNIQRINK